MYTYITYFISSEHRLFSFSPFAQKILLPSETMGSRIGVLRIIPQNVRLRFCVILKHNRIHSEIEEYNTIFNGIRATLDI